MTRADLRTVTPFVTVETRPSPWCTAGRVSPHGNFELELVIIRVGSSVVAKVPQ